MLKKRQNGAVQEKKEATYVKALKLGKEKRRLSYRRKISEQIRRDRAEVQKSLGRIPVTVKPREKPIDFSNIVNLDRPSKAKEINKAGRNYYSMKALRAALRNVETEAGKVPIFEHFIRRAYESDVVLKALMAKLMPDLKSIDAKIVQKSPFKLILDVKPFIPELPE